MLLAIDVGNTNTVFALIDQGEILHRWRISTHAQRTSDEYLVWLTQLMDIAERGGSRIANLTIDRVIIATVVPPTLFNLTRLARTHLNVAPITVGPDLDLGVGVDVPNPKEVGADRLVNSAAAFHEHGDGLIIVDFGTATTFDVVLNGAYSGGAISPGINLAVDALYAASAQLPRIAVAPPEDGRALATGTVNAMQSGIFFGYVGLIDGLCRRIAAEAGRDMKVIATGGLATIFLEHSEMISEVDIDLTVKGLMLIEQRNSV
ncbi:type III pantothenate kinase [Pacificimonas sp. WHA3]|uniref:Type III pantothenate kinase n=1 Tax=Pacificimonas pallii TaxID=2827236 RepID=A0ABS6SE42_9SPHN|nr:type III pantothenate kinase [Pacificimonas pallii]MBV7256687.1 type III pantothenate kinase [Pacificimonas pallii]